jgi:hypothetical protein
MVSSGFEFQWIAPVMDALVNNREREEIPYIGFATLA